MVNNASFSLSFTSDIHGYYSNIDYATGREHASGLCNCAGLFARGGNSLVIDGGDFLQGSPFTYFYHKTLPDRDTDYLPSRIMNAAGYQYITLGNHDFNYGVPTIERFLEQLDAVCLCANVEGIRGVRKTAVATLENGLRIGLTGATSHFVSLWEPPENLTGVKVVNAFDALADALAELKRQRVDCTVCIYHGGYERDVNTGKLLSDTDENQGYRICRKLDFDILLCGHQHLRLDGADVFGTHTCQPPSKGAGFISLTAGMTPGGEARCMVESRFVPAGEARDEKIWSILSAKEEEASAWLDRPVGEFDSELETKSHIEMAEKGSFIANFFNQVQREISGAQISVTCLDNSIKGFSRKVSIRDIVSNYAFPNTLKTIVVDRAVLKSVLERCAEYFERKEDGSLDVSDAFRIPIEQHYNYDYFSGIEVVFDIRNPVGSRVTSIRYQGRELDDKQKLTLCINNYRQTGAGGYEAYTRCEKINDSPAEISEIIMNYLSSHRKITVDKTRWLTVIS